MDYRFLGNTGLKVSELCFGTMTFGGIGGWQDIGRQSQRDADELVRVCIDAGVNFFDTADMYSNGVSEELLGKAIGDLRRETVIATKVHFRMGDGPNDVGQSRHHIIESCHASLRRLNTDYIDLYQVHLYDHATPLEETLRALDDLVRQGKVRYIGCSNYAGWQLMKALSISERGHLEKYATLQAYYSLVGRELEFELMPLCIDQKVGILVWSPLAGGFLSGKFRRGQPKPDGARYSSPAGGFLGFNEEKGYEVVEALSEMAQRRGVSVAQVALNYVLRKPAISSVIIGAKNKEQLADNLNASNWTLTPEEIAALDKVSEPPRIYPYWMLDANKGNR